MSAAAPGPETGPQATQGPRRLAAASLFFPVAAAYGAAVVPLSVHGLLTGDGLAPGLSSVHAHAHELLFGFALAVVAGFLITRTTGPRLALLFATWLLGRAGAIMYPGGAMAIFGNTAFAILLATMAAPQFLRSAKKWRNKAIGPLVLALCLGVLGFHLAGSTAHSSGLQWLALRETVLLLALLMLFMGGRIIAPAAAGAIQAAGGHLEARVQPRIEGAVLVLMGLAALSLPLPAARPMTGGLALATAALSLARLLRWRLWACRGRPDLWCLGIGYGWLVVGLALLGLSWSFELLPASSATHAITVGALGTLAAVVMARVQRLREKLDPATLWSLPWIAGCMGLAALVRLAGHDSAPALGLAAGLWSLGLLLLLPALLPRRFF
jgi:uncharacterized protein involved in response to NO